MKLAAVISGGKDSWYSYYKMLREGYEIPVVVTFIPKRDDSYMFHHPLADKVSSQLKKMDVKHYVFEVSGEKEKEVEEMKKKLREVVEKEGIEGLISGAVKSNYQRQRIDKICSDLGIKSFAPLWHMDEERMLKEIVDSGFEFLVTEICAEGVEKWEKVVIKKGNLEDFIKDLKEVEANVSAEGGDYETFVVKSPMFVVEDFEELI